MEIGIYLFLFTGSATKVFLLQFPAHPLMIFTCLQVKKIFGAGIAKIGRQNITQGKLVERIQEFLGNRHKSIVTQTIVILHNVGLHTYSKP